MYNFLIGAIKPVLGFEEIIPVIVLQILLDLAVDRTAFLNCSYYEYYYLDSFMQRSGKMNPNSVAMRCCKMLQMGWRKRRMGMRGQGKVEHDGDRGGE